MASSDNASISDPGDPDPPVTDQPPPPIPSDAVPQRKRKPRKRKHHSKKAKPAQNTTTPDPQSDAPEPILEEALETGSPLPITISDPQTPASEVQVPPRKSLRFEPTPDPEPDAPESTEESMGSGLALASTVSDPPPPSEVPVPPRKSLRFEVPSEEKRSRRYSVELEPAAEEQDLPPASTDPPSLNAAPSQRSIKREPQPEILGEPAASSALPRRSIRPEPVSEIDVLLESTGARRGSIQPEPPTEPPAPSESIHLEPEPPSEATELPFTWWPLSSLSEPTFFDKWPVFNKSPHSSDSQQSSESSDSFLRKIRKVNPVSEAIESVLSEELELLPPDELELLHEELEGLSKQERKLLPRKLELALPSEELESPLPSEESDVVSEESASQVEDTPEPLFYMDVPEIISDNETPPEFIEEPLEVCYLRDHPDPETFVYVPPEELMKDPGECIFNWPRLTGGTMHRRHLPRKRLWTIPVAIIDIIISSVALYPVYLYWIYGPDEHRFVFTITYFSIFGTAIVLASFMLLMVSLGHGTQERDSELKSRCAVNRCKCAVIFWLMFTYLRFPFEIGSWYYYTFYIRNIRTKFLYPLKTRTGYISMGGLLTYEKRKLIWTMLFTLIYMLMVGTPHVYCSLLTSVGPDDEYITTDEEDNEDESEEIEEIYVKCEKCGQKAQKIKKCKTCKEYPV